MDDSPNLDFLRANAVLMVLVSHVLGFYGIRRFGPFDLEAMGVLGVLMFFVHTSFVLMLSLERQLAKFGRERLFLIFMVRRCFRIYPLSLLVVGVIALFKLPLMGPPWGMHWPSITGHDILFNLLLVQNVTGSPSLPGPLWSLPYEMQMYLLLPALFLLAGKLKSARTLAGGCLLVTTALAVWIHFGHGYHLKYVPCFLPGILAYKISLRPGPGWPFRGFVLMLWSSVAVFMMLYTVEAGWAICFILGAAIPQFAPLSSRPLQRASHLIAKYSYGIYLTHFFALWLAFMKFTSLPKVGQWFVFVTAVLLIPIVLYHLVEQPLIRTGRKLAEERLALPHTQALAGGAA
jgi:peptidoglycan/LPS O-acetylase OafA/YrhL